MARKTFKVEEFVIWANANLARECNDFLTVDHKEGIINCIELVLHDTGNYKGFRYLDSYDSEDPDFAIGGIKNVRRQYAV